MPFSSRSQVAEHHVPAGHRHHDRGVADRAGRDGVPIRPASRPEAFGSFVDGFVRALQPLQN
jgi:hypothetical protein